VVDIQTRVNIIQFAAIFCNITKVVNGVPGTVELAQMHGTYGKEFFIRPECFTISNYVYTRAIQDYDNKGYSFVDSDWNAVLRAGVLEEFLHAMKFPEKGGPSQFSHDKIETFCRRVEEFIEKRRANGYLY